MVSSMENDICIFCDKCQKRVDKIITTHLFRERTFSIKVFCHGESQEMRIEEDALNKELIAAITKANGRAFIEPKQPKAITN
jgi:hypothetical protein